MDLIYVTITHQHCEASRYPDFDTVKWIELHSMVTGVTNVQNCVVDNLTTHQKEQLNEGKRLFVISEDNNFIGYLITNEAYIEQIKTEENSALNFGSFKWVPDLASDLEHLVSVTEHKHHTVLPFDLSVYFVKRAVPVKLTPAEKGFVLIKVSGMGGIPTANNRIYGEDCKIQKSIDGDIVHDGKVVGEVLNGKHYIDPSYLHQEGSFSMAMRSTLQPNGMLDIMSWDVESIPNFNPTSFASFSKEKKIELANKSFDTILNHPADLEVVSEDVTYDKDGNFISRDAIVKQFGMLGYDFICAPSDFVTEILKAMTPKKPMEEALLSLEEKERILNSKVIKPLTTLDSTIAGCPAVSLLGPATKVDDVEGSEVYIEVEVEDAYLIDEAKAKALSVLKDMTLSDNPTLNANVEKFKATEYNEALDNFDLFNDKDKQ